MTPERIAELRRNLETSESWHKASKKAGAPFATIPTADLRALLAECERVSKIAELLQAGTMRSHGFMRGGEFSVIFETVEEARTLHDLLDALTPPQPAGAQP